MRTRFSATSCPVCQVVFTPSRRWQRFCSAPCRSAGRRLQEADRLREILARALPEDRGAGGMTQAPKRCCSFCSTLRRANVLALASRKPVFLTRSRQRAKVAPRWRKSARRKWEVIETGYWPSSTAHFGRSTHRRQAGPMVPASSSPQLPGVVEPKRQTLLADDFVRDRDASVKRRSNIRPPWRRNTRPSRSGSEFPERGNAEERSGCRSGRGLAGFLAVFEAIAVAVELEDVDVMGQPVEQRAGEAFGAEDLGPFVEGEIRGHGASTLARSAGRRSRTAARRWSLTTGT